MFYSPVSARAQRRLAALFFFFAAFFRHLLLRGLFRDFFLGFPGSFAHFLFCGSPGNLAGRFSLGFFGGLPSGNNVPFRSLVRRGLCGRFARRPAAAQAPHLFLQVIDPARRLAQALRHPGNLLAGGHPEALHPEIHAFFLMPTATHHAVGQLAVQTAVFLAERHLGPRLFLRVHPQIIHLTQRFDLRALPHQLQHLAFHQDKTVPTSFLPDLLVFALQLLELHPQARGLLPIFLRFRGLLVAVHLVDARRLGGGRGGEHRGHGSGHGVGPLLHHVLPFPHLRLDLLREVQHRLKILEMLFKLLLPILRLRVQVLAALDKVGELAAELVVVRQILQDMEERPLGVSRQHVGGELLPHRHHLGQQALRVAMAGSFRGRNKPTEPFIDLAGIRRVQVLSPKRVKKRISHHRSPSAVSGFRGLGRICGESCGQWLAPSTGHQRSARFIR